jgi:hypothetical protein
MPKGVNESDRNRTRAVGLGGARHGPAVAGLLSVNFEHLPCMSLLPGVAGHHRVPWRVQQMTTRMTQDDQMLIGIVLTHACTDPHDSPASINDRPRDVVDVLLL